jgi:GntR family transcriptional regulator
MPIRHDDPRPPFQQLADDLRMAIANGDLAAGQRLPSNRELAEEYGIAPMTVQSAVRVLRDEGLVIAHQGRGTFVHDDAQARAADRAKHPAGDVSAIAAELRTIQDTLQGLDDRLSKVEQQVSAAAHESPAQAPQSGE